jgi:hypothetical protein
MRRLSNSPRLVKDPERELSDLVAGSARVLLINPPVYERRYHWLRWNQPSDLLRLSSWIKSKSRRAEVRLYDFMFPTESGDVPKKKVADSWREGGRQLWHFGQRFEEFEKTFTTWQLEKWRPTIIIITSLTSYWHRSIEQLLVSICNRLKGENERRSVAICLYGNYPRFEPQHALTQRDADVVFARPIHSTGIVPDFGLYAPRAPLYYGLDIYDPNLDDHISECFEAEEAALKAKNIARPASLTIAFLNADIGEKGNQWEIVGKRVEASKRTDSAPARIMVEGISGIEPRSLTRPLLEKLKAANVRSLFVEHARSGDGGLDIAAYATLRDVMDDELRQKRHGAPRAWLDKAAVTGFVSMGLPGENLDALVESTLHLNQLFQAVILKPFGYSPDIDTASHLVRTKRWSEGPCAGSPQWFPYADGNGGLGMSEYADLIRWQNVLNKRVKGTTFDFLNGGTVAQLVRETLVMESWKRHREVR